MIVDDDEDDRMLFGEALLHVKESCTLLTADNGPNALKLLGEEDAIYPDIIFLDLNMPMMSGWDCLKLLRKIGPVENIPVVIYSTSQQSESFEKIKSMEKVHFFTKPARFSDLMTGISHVLHARWDSVGQMNSVAFKLSNS